MLSLCALCVDTGSGAGDWCSVEYEEPAGWQQSAWVLRLARLPLWEQSILLNMRPLLI